LLQYILSKIHQLLLRCTQDASLREINQQNRRTKKLNLILIS